MASPSAQRSSYWSEASPPSATGATDWPESSPRTHRHRQAASRTRCNAHSASSTWSARQGTTEPQPLGPRRTPGGSSSGSGAAVGARILPAALAEQTAGSGMRPGRLLRRQRHQADLRPQQPLRHVPDGWSTTTPVSSATTIKTLPSVQRARLRPQGLSSVASTPLTFDRR